MTSERGNQSATGDGAPAVGADEIDAVDPEAVAALDEERSVDDDAPAPERFEEFVGDVDAGRVAPERPAEDDVPIDASMDELFAER